MSSEIVYPALVSEKGSLTKVEKQILGSFIMLSGASTILELGAYKGVTTKFICNFLKENNSSAKLFSFDVPDVVAVLEKDTELLEFINSGQLTFVSGYLPFTLKNWLLKYSQTIDIVLDDALHDYKSVYEEVRLIWPRLSTDGYILCHDYTDKYWGVIHAVNKFSRRYGTMNLSLHSSPTAATGGFGSVLVVLRKQKFSIPIPMAAGLEWERVKGFLVRTVLWKKLRPMLRRGK